MHADITCKKVRQKILSELNSLTVVIKYVYGMLHAWVKQIVMFCRYGLSECPQAIFEPGNQSRVAKLA